jgi:hypothetical protein
MSLYLVWTDSQRIRLSLVNCRIRGIWAKVSTALTLKALCEIF